MRSRTSLFLGVFLSLWLVFVMTSLSFGREIKMKGVYNKTDIYVQNPHDGDNNYCITEILINDKSIPVPKQTAFAIKPEEAAVSVGQPVSIIIRHGGNCAPKVLNPDALKSKAPFRFQSGKVSEEKVHWSVLNETEEGTYYIQHEKSGTWVNVAIWRPKGEKGVVSYVQKVSHFKGRNRYRVRYLDENGKYYYSKVFFHDAQKESVSFYPKRVSDKIMFTSEVKYKIMNSKGDVLKEGRGKEVDCSDLSMGAYRIVFDGRTERFLKK